MNLIKSVCNSYQSPYDCNAQLYAIQQLGIGLIAQPLLTIIHESAHATAARLFYLNSNPEIKIPLSLFGGGRCEYYGDQISRVGEWLGKANAEAIIAAAGPIAEMTASLALLKLYPGNGISAISLLSNTLYTISAIKEKGFYTRKFEDLSGNDFVQIKFYKGAWAANTLIIISLTLGIFAANSLVQQSLANAYSH